MNPLDLRGPEFLQFYLIYGLSVLAAGWLAWLYLRSRSERCLEMPRWSPGVYPRDGDAYHIALLRGGPGEVVRTLLGRLLSSGLITLSDDRIYRSNDAPPPPLGPLETEALNALPTIDQGVTAQEGESLVRASVSRHLSSLERDLQNQGLSLSAAHVQRFQGLRLIVLAALLGLGLTKAVVAISRGRTNLGFLVLMMIGYTVAAFFLLRPPRRARTGDRYLSWLQESHRGLASMLAHGRRADLSELALVAGIYGLQILPEMSPLQRAFRASHLASGGSGDGGGWSSGGDSGDSGGGDSGGGGGCGGGGCGGGGCGGCGSS